MAGDKALRGIDTLIGRGCRIDGDLVFGGGLRIDGQVHGDIRAEPLQESYLVVARSGQIHGGIRAGHVVIDGQVSGNLHITGRVELLARARIIGDIHYLSLGMQAGAAVTGQLYPEGEAGTHRQLPDEQLLKLA